MKKILFIILNISLVFNSFANTNTSNKIKLVECLTKDFNMKIEVDKNLSNPLATIYEVTATNIKEQNPKPYRLAFYLHQVKGEKYDIMLSGPEARGFGIYYVGIDLNNSTVTSGLEFFEDDEYNEGKFYIHQTTSCNITLY